MYHPVHILFMVGLAVAFFTACGEADSVRTDATHRDEELIARNDSAVARSLFGKPLYPVPLTVSQYREMDSLLQIAEQNYLEDGRNLDNIIWYGRRLAYLNRYAEAMSVYTRGLHLHPNSPEIYRHRGHRYITLRKFEEAENDLTLAAQLVRGRPVETEPDGIPNKINKPLSSLQFNIWYHLGLAYYLQGEYGQALTAYDTCMQYATNPDLLCAVTDWTYLSAMRSGDTLHARRVLEDIDRRMEIIENRVYHQRLLMYKGIVEPEELMDFDTLSSTNALQVVTQGYGVANFFLFQDNKGVAKKICDDILATPYWPAFGYIAAEADRARAVL